MYDEIMGGGAFVWVRSIFLEVSVVYIYIRRITRTSIFGGHLARVLHAELSSNVLMEPACHFANYLDSRIASFHIQAHWGDTDSCRSGHSSGSFRISKSPLCICYFFQERCPPRVEFTILLFKQKRCCTQSLSGLLR